MRSRLIGAACAVALLGFVSPVWAGVTPVVGVPDPNNVAPTFNVSGTVVDPLGQPIEGATVTDAPEGDTSLPGYHTTTTDSNGAYQLEGVTLTSHEEDFSARWIPSTITASKQGYETATDDISFMATVDGTTFTLPWHIGASVSPPSFRTNPTGTVTIAVTATSAAPSDACVTFTRAAGDTTPVAMALQGTSGGISTWTTSVDVADDDVLGNHGWTVAAKQCADETALAKAATGNFVVDNGVPVIDTASVGPLATSSTAPVIKGKVLDYVDAAKTKTLNNVDNAGVHVKIDGNDVAATYLPSTERPVAAGIDARAVPVAAVSGLVPGTQIGLFSVQAPTLGSGSHSLEVTITDRAGNQSSVLSTAIVVEQTAPSISNPTVDGQAATSDPNTVTITNNQPTIEVTVSDASIDASGITMSISDGTLTGRAAPSYSGSTLSYTVPLAGGAFPGQHVLAPGSYVVHIFAKDSAGNVSSLDFAFKVTA